MSGPLRASVVGLFPESLRGFTDASILGRAQKAGLLEIEEVQLRDFADDKHRTVDDTPCGGGPGMILRADRLLDALDHTVAKDDAIGPGRRRRVVLLDPAGRRFDHHDAAELAAQDHVVFVCGRYEGIDARVEAACDDVLSIGDYVLTGGELAALVMIDAAARLREGVLGNSTSKDDESHRLGLLEHRQYTRPVEVRGRRVPPVLLSGDHGLIERARERDALQRTLARRSDLLDEPRLSSAQRRLLDDEGVPTLDPIEAAEEQPADGEQ